MTDLSSYKVIAGETSSSTKFGNFVQAVQDTLNGLPPAQLTQSGATVGQTLAWSGAAWVPTTVASVPVVYRKLTEKDVANTVTPTDLLNAEVTVAAAAMATTKTVRATLAGDYLNSDGAARSTTLEILFGATSVFKSTFQGQNGAGDRRPWRLQFEITNLGVANSQWLDGTFSLGAAVAATTGLGALQSVANTTAISVENAQYQIGVISTNGVVTVDTTSSQTLTVVATHSAASANLSMRLKRALVEVI